MVLSAASGLPLSIGAVVGKVSSLKICPLCASTELGAGLRYLSQRFSMPDDRVKATLSDIGTEELGHWEMLGTMIRQCMQGCSCEELDAAGLAGYYVMHDHGVFPCDPNGVPFSSSTLAVTGDPIADLVEDMAAEQKARATYEHLMNMTTNEQIIEPLCFLREREVVHFQRFGECLDIVQCKKPPCGTCRCCGKSRARR